MKWENWIEVTQSLLRKLSQLFSGAALMLFAIFGELLVVYYHNISQELKMCTSLPSSEQVDKERKKFNILNGLADLSKATLLLHQRFYSMIIIHLCLTISNMFTYSYYLIDNFENNRLIGVVWEVICVFHSVINLWIICHTTDRIRTAVSSLSFIHAIAHSLTLLRVHYRQRVAFLLCAIFVTVIQ